MRASGLYLEDRSRLNVDQRTNTRSWDASAAAWETANRAQLIEGACGSLLTGRVQRLVVAG